jgi:hypothetical protein
LTFAAKFLTSDARARKGQRHGEVIVIAACERSRRDAVKKLSYLGGHSVTGYGANRKRHMGDHPFAHMHRPLEPEPPAKPDGRKGRNAEQRYRPEKGQHHLNDETRTKLAQMTREERKTWRAERKAKSTLPQVVATEEDGRTVYVRVSRKRPR